MQTFDAMAGNDLAYKRHPAFPEADYSADMLHRTIQPDSRPDRFDYVVIARIARDMRNQHVASLLSRAKHALAERFARRARGAWLPSR